MKTAVEKRPPSEVATLSDLVIRIKFNLAKGEEYYRAVGKDLILARKAVPKGEWYEWLDENFHLSISTAMYYMKIARGERSRVFKSEAHKTLHRNINKIAGSINLAAMSREAEDREVERKLLRSLSVKIIDIGYKVLAAKMHPDKPGGSKEAMQRLNEAKRSLMAAL